MRRDIESIDNMVDRSINDGFFSSRADCATAMLNWLVLGSYVDPAQFSGGVNIDQQHESAVEDDAYALGTISSSEGARLQYEILRERDA